MHKRLFSRLRLPIWARHARTWLLHRVHNMTRWQRIVCGVVAVVIVLSVVVPTTLIYVTNQRYKLSAAVEKIVGSPNANLASKITFNSDRAAWQFNAGNIPIGSGDGSSPAQQASMPTTEQLKAQLGGSGEKDESLYAVDMPTDGKKGVRYYDTNTDLSFSLVPQFGVGEGRRVDGRIVYPSSNDTKLIYTAKANGMKEDIILNKPVGDELEFRYKLELPDTLKARIQDDGSLGVFSPDPLLFGNISMGQDREKILSARQTATKDHLLFVLPAPVIVESGGKETSSHTRFVLNDDVLMVKATKLANLQYPLSVDPSVVVTSSSDFTDGNGDNISYDTGQISRGTLTGGSISGGWSSTSSGSFSTRFGAGSVAYNGYAYNVGGYNGTSTMTEVNYTPINSNGTLGAWNTTTSLPSGRMYSAAIAYGGRMYVYGGYSSGSTPLNSVIYATINSDGTLGSWSVASNTMATGVCRFGWTEFDGYLYAAGGASGTLSGNCGNSSSTNNNTLQYARILGNGDVSAWSTSANSFTSARKDPGLAVYNGFLYLSSGTSDGATTYRDTQYAKIGTNGDIGAWSTSAQLTPTTGNYRFGYRAYNGYLYMSGGTNNQTGTRYAQILANGDIGAWTATANMSGVGRYGQGFVIYKGYIYYYGGNDTSSYLNDTAYAKIDPAGVTGSFGTVANNFTTARALPCSVAYNGYLYAVGGSTSDNSGGNVTTVQYTAINSSTGNVGSWSSTTALPEARGSAGCTAYAGYLYVVGGFTGTSVPGSMLSTVRYAPINSNGTLGTWVTTAPSVPQSVARGGVFTYATSSGTYLYSVGGETQKTYYALIASNGSIGSWTTSSNNLINASYKYQAFSQVGKYIFAAGGWNNSNNQVAANVEYTSITSSGDISAWSSTTALNTAIGYSNGTTVNGCIYAVGGENTATTSLANVQYACPNANGTISAWYNAPNLSVATTDMGVTSYNGYIYGVGGYTTSSQTTTQFAAVNNGGTGKVGSWTSASTPSGISGYHQYAATVYNGYIYINGGQQSSTVRAYGYYAKLNNDGSLGTWQSLPNLNTARMAHSLFAVNGTLYAVSGYSGTAELGTTEYATINSDGSVGSWQTATANLSTNARDGSGYADYNGYIYLLGGNDGSDKTTVSYANVSSGGNFSSWSTTTALPTALYNPTAVAYGGYMYVLGGSDANATTLYNKVFSAPINSNGTIGSWSYTTSLPISANVPAAASNGFIYVFGGSNAASGSTSVYKAPLYTAGMVGNWQVTSTIPTSDITVRKGFINNGTAYSLASGASVASAPLEMSVRKSTYSKLLNLGGAYRIASMTYGGTLPNGGLSNVAYKAANNTGVFGSAQSATALPGIVVGCAGVVDTQYLHLQISLDDSATAIFPDSNSSVATLTDLTVNYQSPRAESNQRLAHGKFFSGESLQGLDTCTQ